MCLKVLQVGDFQFDYYDESLYHSFNASDKVQVDRFKWNSYFSNYSYHSMVDKFYYTLENRYKVGPLVRKLNHDLLVQAKKHNYGLVFLWRAVHIYPATIRELKKHAVVIGYNNDQTFSPHHPWWLFYILKRSIRFYDHYLVYRSSELKVIEECGVSASLFLPTFDRTRTYPIESCERCYDVAFIGHYENDGRDTLLLQLVKEGFNVRLNGQQWQKSEHYDELVAYLGEITPVYEGYNEALNSAKVCLSFLSKINNDTFTRRTLEIPATKTVMLAEYTHDQADMFEPDTEAVYFTNHQEAISKLKRLITRPELAESIARAGYQRVLAGPYQLSDRVDDILNVFRRERLKKNEKK